MKVMALFEPFFAWCLHVGEDGHWAGHLCHIDTFLVQYHILFYRPRFTYDFCSSYDKCVPTPIFSSSVISTFLSCWKAMVFSITTYPFTRHRSPYISAVNKMPCFFAMAKECNIFSFELHSNMLNLHWNGDVFNQKFVISPRTGILYACPSPYRQNLTTLALGEKWFLFLICLEDYNSSLII